MSISISEPDTKLKTYSKAVALLLENGLCEPAETLMELKGLPIPEPELVLKCVFNEMSFGRINELSFGRVLEISDNPIYNSEHAIKFRESVKFIISRHKISQECMSYGVQSICANYEMYSDLFVLLLAEGLIVDADCIRKIIHTSSLDALNYLVTNNYIPPHFMEQILMVDGEFMPFYQNPNVDFLDKCLQLYCEENPCPTLKINKLLGRFMRWSHDESDSLHKFFDIFEKHSVKIYFTQDTITSFETIWNSHNVIKKLMHIAVTDSDIELNTNNEKIYDELRTYGVNIKYLARRARTPREAYIRKVSDGDTPRSGSPCSSGYITPARSRSPSPKRLYSKYSDDE